MHPTMATPTSQGPRPLRGFRVALAFLTRLPGGVHADSGAAVGRSVGWFPVVGALVGLLGGASYWGANLVTSNAVAAVVAFAVTAAATGALHEDGLADTVDALAGGLTVEDRQRILSDPRHGTFGVLSLVLLTVAKVGALAAVDVSDAVGLLIVAHLGARLGSVFMLAFAPISEGQGSARSVAVAVGRPGVFYAVIVGAGLTVLALFNIVDLLVGLSVTVGAIAFSVALMTLWAWKRVGGINGDTIGAAEQLSELSVLVLLGGLLT